MGVLTPGEVDSWLREGKTVVAASERVARRLAARYHHARQFEGRTAWSTPDIQDWNRFIRRACADRLADERLVLNPIQERSLWADIIQQHSPQSALLEGPRHRLAAMAMDAHELLCFYAPKYLRFAARSGWQNDAAAFSQWLNLFDDRCREEKLISSARLPLALLAHLHRESTNESRSPLLIAGFDRLLPVHRSLFNSWGEWHEAIPSAPAACTRFYQAPDHKSELEACTVWCARKLAQDPSASILLVALDIGENRGQIERALLRATGVGSFEFSLGVPLSHVPLPQAILFLLRWFSVPLAEHELDWLFSSGYISANLAESRALQQCMRAIRRKNEQQPVWSFEAWLTRARATARHDPSLSAWITRMVHVHHLFSDRARHPHNALEWSEFVPHWLESIRFAEASPLTSTEFQALRRWQSALESTGSVGIFGRKISYDDFLSLLSRTFDETVFALESHDAPIQITGPAESAAFAADAIWFLGATENAWPASGTTHPLLPHEVQHGAEMPHADPRLDWSLCQTITARLVHSGNEVYFSYGRQNQASESLPSRLVELAAGPPVPLPSELRLIFGTKLRTVAIEDYSQVPFPSGRVSGGASVLTLQSHCPFQAFAVARLGAEDWEPAQVALTPAQRGRLLHAVLHRMWAELRSVSSGLAQLQQRNECDQFTALHVRQVFAEELNPALTERMPARYLQLEQERLTELVSSWLEFEMSRIDFAVLETEAERTVTVAGLTFDLRLDRIDKLSDDTLLVIDYKTGDVKPKVWELPRPEDIQLPLYAGFALPKDSSLGGLVFAKIRPGRPEFAGHLRSASTTLIPALNGASGLVRRPLNAQILTAWRIRIEELARAFLAGRAEVDPREYPRTCDRCGLHTLCRVNETRSKFGNGDDPGPLSGFVEMPDA